jgi:hypothetical protein
MRTKSHAALVAATLGMTAWALPTAALATEDEPEPVPELPIEVSPTSGPAGTLISVSGSGCVNPDGPAPLAEVFVYPLGSEGVDNWSSVDVAEDGSWSSDGFGVSDVVIPELDYAVSARCYLPPDEVNGDNVILFEYEDVAFDVTPPPAPEPTTPPTTEPSAPAPPPATPVVAPPDHTG